MLHLFAFLFWICSMLSSVDTSWNNWLYWHLRWVITETAIVVLLQWRQLSTFTKRLSLQTLLIFCGEFFFFFFFFKSSVFRCERWWHGVNRDGKQRGQDLKFKWLLSPQHLLPWHPFENIANQSCGSAPNMKRTHTYTRTMHNSANTQTLEPLVSHLLCVCVNVSSSFLINAMRTSAHTHTHTHTHTH